MSRKFGDVGKKEIKKNAYLQIRLDSELKEKLDKKFNIKNHTGKFENRLSSIIRKFLESLVK
jgi:hypothetical protein